MTAILDGPSAAEQLDKLKDFCTEIGYDPEKKFEEALAATLDSIRSQAESIKDRVQKKQEHLLELRKKMGIKTGQLSSVDNLKACVLGDNLTSQENHLDAELGPLQEQVQAIESRINTLKEKKNRLVDQNSIDINFDDMDDETSIQNILERTEKQFSSVQDAVFAKVQESSKVQIYLINKLLKCFPSTEDGRLLSRYFDESIDFEERINLLKQLPVNISEIQETVEKSQGKAIFDLWCQYSEALQLWEEVLKTSQDPQRFKNRKYSVFAEETRKRKAKQLLVSTANNLVSMSKAWQEAFDKSPCNAAGATIDIDNVLGSIKAISVSRRPLSSVNQDAAGRHGKKPERQAARPTKASQDRKNYKMESNPIAPVKDPAKLTVEEGKGLDSDEPVVPSESPSPVPGQEAMGVQLFSQKNAKSKPARPGWAHKRPVSRNTKKSQRTQPKGLASPGSRSLASARTPQRKPAVPRTVYRAAPKTRAVDSTEDAPFPQQALRKPAVPRMVRKDIKSKASGPSGFKTPVASTSAETPASDVTMFKSPLSDGIAVDAGPGDSLPPVLNPVRGSYIQLPGNPFTAAVAELEASAALEAPQALRQTLAK
eukprot:gene1760-2909_t